jgi:AraC-like DNA-binding protein
LGHLFSEQVGLPFRPFALWLRLQGVLGHLAHGANLTQAAHGAGFADSAHLTRTFRRMFGIAPSSLARQTTST